jgi:hypothetical protein
LKRNFLLPVQKKRDIIGIMGRTDHSLRSLTVVSKEKGSERMRTICVILGAIVFLWFPGAEAKDFKFPEIGGWKRSAEIQTFVPKTLYEYINGAADLYLSYDFEELKVAEYVNEKKASVSVDVYRHRTPVHAFGIYSQEKLPSASLLDIGVQGYYEKNVLIFWTGSYYVKINSFNTGTEDQEILLTFAGRIAGNLGEKGALPSILTAFPPEGKVKNSEKFIARNFLGYSFLHSAFTADYELPGKKFRLFVIEGRDANECGNMVQKYIEQTGETGKSIAEGNHSISDPHHGEIDLYWRGAHLWGILSLNDAALRSKYLKLFEEGFQKGKL